MFRPDTVYKIQTKEKVHFTAKIIEETDSHILIRSVIDDQEDILHKDNVLKARPADQNSTGDKDVRT